MEVTAHLLSRLDALIDANGWTVTAVHGGTTTQPFAHTLGLTRLHKPEVLVLGLPPDPSHAMLGAVARRLSAGETLPMDTPLSDIVAGLPVVLRRIHPSYTSRDYVFFAVARRYYRLDEVPAVQLIWPDEAGHFAWDDGFNELCRTPILDQPGHFEDYRSP